MQINAIRGFSDILSEDAALWAEMENLAREVFGLYGFEEIRVPIVERTELFKRTIGDTTDIVEKQMYTFTDLKGDSLTLRPEGTAPVVRAYIENKLYTVPVQRLFYFGPMFRYERPQKGRYRQFHQIGAELLGELAPSSDAEVIQMLEIYLDRLGLKDKTIEINTLGCAACRPAYRDALLLFLKDKVEDLCENCQRRVEKNPLRALDCKSAKCIEATQNAPSTIDHACAECSEHFNGVKDTLEKMAVTFEINPRMVRGLDYYTKTAFEVTATGLGAQNSVAAGGRYDNLTKELSGPEVPCFGFAIGFERLAMLLNKENFNKAKKVVLIALGDDAVTAALKKGGTLDTLREAGLRVIFEHSEASVKSKMKKANKLGADYVLIIGEDELKEGTVTFKDMEKGEQVKTQLSDIIKMVKA